MQKEIGMGRLVAYHRSSTDEVLSPVECFGESFSQVFVDKDLSIDASRPELRRMIGYLEENDSVVVESLHCLGYCFSDLQSVIKSILEKGCSVRVRDENLTFCPNHSAEGHAILQLLSAFVRAERPMLSGLLSMKSLVTEQQPSIKSNARATVTPQEASRLQEMSKAGVSIGALQKEFNLTRGAINRILMTAA